MHLLNPSAIDAAAVLDWYDRHARELPWRVAPGDRARGIGPDPYRVWLSEVMLQQTTVAAVKSYFVRFTSLWPTVLDLASAPLDSVLKEWAGLGYYARARNLHACAQAVVSEHGGVFPATSLGLQTLPGIGAYTSAAIAAICFDEPIAVLDGNLDRVLARYYALEVPVREAKEELRAALQASVPQRAGDYAQAMMDLGATICAPRAALCMLCPIQPGCIGTKTGEPTRYPVKPVKAERPVRKGHAYVMLDGDGDVYLQSRPAKGLLGGMTEVPGSDWAAELPVATYPVAANWRHRGQVVHIFTHFRLELEVWSAAVAPDQLEAGWWAAPAALKGEALPTLFRKVLAAAGLGVRLAPTSHNRKVENGMEQKRLGNSGLKVSRLCLGCMTYGAPGEGNHPWTLVEEDSRPFIRQALDLGITFFDTANTYSDGSSEEIVGRAFKDFVRREDIVLATKVNGVTRRTDANAQGLSRRAIMREIDASLQRLQTDYVDLYQIHRWDNETPIEETMEALHDVVRAGKATYIGASSMAAWQFSKAQYVAKANGWTPFVSMQNQLNLLYREEEREMLPLCADQGVGIIPWSPQGRGLLSRPWGEQTNRAGSDAVITKLYAHTAANDRLVVEAVQAVAGRHGVAMSQVALAWVLQNPLVTAPIIGASKPHHLQDAVAALDLKLTAEDTAELEGAYRPRDAVI